MKKVIHTILALSAASVLWTGCSEDAAGENHGRMIDFSCTDTKSRVPETDADNMSSFRVSAVWTKSPGVYVPTFMDEQAVEKNPDNVWEYSPVCYMPSAGTVDFFAYSPADAAVSGFGFNGTPYNQVGLTYEVTTDPAAQHDFMVAATIGQTETPVPLEFRHMLSSVSVKVRNMEQAFICRVYKVELLNLFRRGTLTGVADKGLKTTEWTWSGQSGLTSYTITGSTPIDIGGNLEPIPIPGPSATPLMILPQPVGKGDKDDVVKETNIAGGEFPAWMLGMPKDVLTKFYVAVTYELFDASDSVTGHSTTVYLPLADPDDANKQFVFVPGTKYAFNIDLKFPTTRDSGATPTPRLHVVAEQ